MASRKKGSPKRAKKGAKKKRVVDERLKRKKKPAPRPRPREKKRPKPKPKKRAAPKPKPKPKARLKKKRTPRSKKDKALRDLVRDLGPKKAAKRLGKTEKTLEGWTKNGVPERSAAAVIATLQRRERGKKTVKAQKERQTEEWNERRRELLAQKRSEVTETKQIAGIKLNVSGEVLGWAPGGTLMRLYAVVSKVTGERRWFWTPSEFLAGYDDVQEFVEFYDIDPNEFEVEMWFGDLLTEAERKAGGLVF